MIKVNNKDQLYKNKLEEVVKMQNKMISKLLEEKYTFENNIEEKNQYIQKIGKENDMRMKYLQKFSSGKVYKLLRKINKIDKLDELINVSDFTLRKNFTNDQNKNYKNYKSYESFYQDNEDFSKYKSEYKPIAFYLPQFHSFKENDEWWGKGFTEWTNTKKTKPIFEGHYQPREPHDDIGYYNLLDINVLKDQIDLAKKHGIYGFCFYYYWFSGKRLMEKPVDMLLKNKDIDFPFCLCWANENWTRTWDGMEKNVLMSQKYSQSDYKKFIFDLKKYVDDERYIKVDGKPLVLIYNPSAIPNLEELIVKWKEYAKNDGIGEIEIITRNFPTNLDYSNVLLSDGEFEFAPIGMNGGSDLYGISNTYMYDYNNVVNNLVKVYNDKIYLKPYYYCCTMGWDNSARRSTGNTIYYNYSLDAFYKWITLITTNIDKENISSNNINKEKIFFVNAWNEWAEGTYLEPDKKFGYANINTFSKALFNIPLKEKKKNLENEENNEEV